MIAIVDYGVGNLFSLKSSFAAIGAEAVVTGKADTLEELLDEELTAPVLKRLAEAGKPLLGICLGMQLLFEKSYEYGEHPGLGLLSGEVRPISEVIPKELKIPHIGWNALKIQRKSPLLRYVKEGDCVYFVHSYYAANCEGSLLATAEYGADLTAAVGLKNIFGCQFHPEKSGEVGLSILRAFAEI